MAPARSVRDVLEAVRAFTSIDGVYFLTHSLVSLRYVYVARHLWMRQQKRPPDSGRF